MNKTVAIFRSRNDTQRYYYALRGAGISCRIISTPIKLERSCGVSVVFKSSDKAKCEYVLSRGKYYSFIGYFAI